MSHKSSEVFLIHPATVKGNYKVTEPPALQISSVANSIAFSDTIPGNPLLSTPAYKLAVLYLYKISVLLKAQGY